MSKGNKTPANQTVTQKQEPWAPIQPDLINVAGQARDLFSQSRSYYPGSTVVPFSGQTRDALAMTEQRARAGSPVTNAMQGELTRTMSGDYQGGAPGTSLYRSLLGGTLGGDIDLARRIATGGDAAGAFRSAAMAGGMDNPATSILGGMAGTNPVGREREIAMLDAIRGFDDPSMAFYETQAGGGLSNNADSFFMGLAGSGARDAGARDIYDRLQGGALGDERRDAMAIGRAGMVDPSQAFYKTAAGGGLANDRLGGLESFTDDANPHLDATFDRMAEKVGNAVGSKFSSAGQYGSTRHARELSEALSGAATDLYGQAYETDANRRLSAAGSLATAGESELARRFAGAQALTDGERASQGLKLQGLGLAGSLGAQDAGIQLDTARSMADDTRADASLRLAAGQAGSNVTEANLARRAAGAAGMSDSARFAAGLRSQNLGMSGNLGMQGAGFGLNAAQAYAGAGDADLARRERAAGASTDAALSGLGAVGNLTGQDTSTRFNAAGGLDNGWNAERSRQLQSMMFAPQAASQDYADLDRLLGVGGEWESQFGRYLTDDMNRWNFNQQDPYDRLTAYNNMLLGLGGQGGTATSTQPLYRQGGGLTGALGGAATGAGLASAMGAAAGGPVGIGAAILGGLLGL